MNDFQQECINRCRVVLRLHGCEPNFTKQGNLEEYFIAEFESAGRVYKIFIYNDGADFSRNQISYQYERAAYDTEEDLIDELCKDLSRMLKVRFKGIFINKKGEKIKDCIDAVNEEQFKERVAKKGWKALSFERVSQADLEPVRSQILSGVFLTMLGGVWIFFQVPKYSLTLIGVCIVFWALVRRKKIIKKYF